MVASGHPKTGKKRDEDDFTSRPLLSKKGKNGMFEVSKKKGTITVLFHQQSSERVMGGETHSRANPSGRTSDQKSPCEVRTKASGRLLCFTRTMFYIQRRGS
jgi:hypothetical protein